MVVTRAPLLAPPSLLAALLLVGCPAKEPCADCDTGGDSADSADSGADSTDSADSGDSTADSEDSGGETGEDSGDDSGDSGGDTGAAPASVLVAYYTSWSVYGRDYQVEDIDVDHLTHINYAFANLSAAGECVLGDSYADIDMFHDGDSWDAGSLRGNFHQLQILKEGHPELRVLLSVGGWTWSSNFSDTAATEGGRATFARTCADLVETYGFDGLDIDWEYPGGGGKSSEYSAADGENYTRLLAAVRAELATRSPPADGRYLLTIAGPADPEKVAHYDLPAMMEHLDWVSVMAYDFNGGWNRTTGHNAPLHRSTGDPGEPTWNVEDAVGAWLAAGVEPDQLVVGMPMYGRGWSGVPATNDGLWQSSTGLPTGTWEAGVFDWSDLDQNYLPRMERHWSDEAKVPWLYDATSGVFISYDDAESLSWKAAFVRDRGLRGGMVWDLSSDDDAHTLLSGLHADLFE